MKARTITILAPIKVRVGPPTDPVDKGLECGAAEWPSLALLGEIATQGIRHPEIAELLPKTQEAPRPPFRWIVCIDVSADTVADGLDLTTDTITLAMQRAFPMARMSDISAKTILAPDTERIALEMGYESAEERREKEDR